MQFLLFAHTQKRTLEAKNKGKQKYKQQRKITKPEDGNCISPNNGVIFSEAFPRSSLFIRKMFHNFIDFEYFRFFYYFLIGPFKEHIKYTFVLSTSLTLSVCVEL